MNRTRISVNQTVIAPIPVFPYFANAPLPFGDAAAVRAEFTLDCSSFERSEIRRKLCFDQPLFCRLGPGGFGKAKEICGGEQAEACPAKA